MGELSVKVSVANRSYPLRIQKEEEQDVINAAHEVNKRIKDIEDNYAVKDKQDLLAMCALQMLTDKKDHHAKQGAKDTFNKSFTKWIVCFRITLHRWMNNPFLENVL